jgi:ribosomal protein L24E
MNQAKCPVCGWDITDGGIPVKSGGKTVVVCCEECAKKAAGERTRPTQYPGQ